MRFIRYVAVLLLLQSSGIGSAVAHPGALDANGCHYEARVRYHCHRDPRPNPYPNAPVKKSRENICHARGTPSYSLTKYFVPYKTMNDCINSGGRAPA